MQAFDPTPPPAGRSADGLARTAQEATLRFVDECRTVTDLRSLRSAMAGWATALGFDGYSYVRTRGDGRALRLGPAAPIGIRDPSGQRPRPDGGIDRLDPDVRAAIALGRLSRWSRPPPATHPVPPQRRATGEPSSGPELAEGIAVPVHDPAGLLAFVVLIADAPAERVDALAAPIQLAATQFHLAAVALDPAGAEAAGAATTSPRERQCAALLARGCTVREIAAALGIAERTVVFHLDNLRRKLGARNRTEAVARLARAGLLEEPAP